MISLIDVVCPHCGTHGQIVVPPVGSIIIGPCPKCSELVVIFCGQVLALDKGTMNSEEIEDRREHLLEVLHGFLTDRISTLLTEDFVVDETAIPEIDVEDFETGEDSFEAFTTETDAEDEQSISQTEVDRFNDIDLKLLDNRAYFKSVFDSND